MALRRTKSDIAGTTGLVVGAAATQVNVPAGSFWVVRALMASIVTSASVGNRFLFVGFATAALVIERRVLWPAAIITGKTSYGETDRGSAATSTALGANTTLQTVPMAQDITLPGGTAIIASDLAGIDLAADQFALEIFYDEYKDIADLQEFRVRML